MTDPVRDVLVIASWFPSISDAVAGRFVADQVSALRQVGCRARVISFDPAGLVGSGPFRARLAAQVDWFAEQSGAHAVGTFSPSAYEATGIPTARLPIANGRTPRDPVLHALRHRGDAL
ncbi:MAG: hypothetical protein ABI598_00360, partial [Chloroflexota bacterium]